MSLFGDIFRADGSTTGGLFGNVFRDPASNPVISLGLSPIERQIAEVMAAQVNADARFDGITAERVVDTKRKLKAMVEGDVLVDCLGVGVRSIVLNRKHFRHEYVTHAAIRCKVTAAKVTSPILDELGLVSQTVQRFFEQENRQLSLSGNAGATLIKAEPFVHYSREQLYGDGVYLCPIEFTWVYKPGA